MTGRSNSKFSPIASMGTLNPPESPPSSPIGDNGENNLQPFFILHKGDPQKGERKTPTARKARRKLDISLASPKSTEKSVEPKQVEEDYYEQLRIEAFQMVWSKIEMTIKEVLRNINISVFNVIHQWVRESFAAIRSTGISYSSHSYTPIANMSCKQICTGLVLTKNVEFVDDLLTFKELGLYLKSQGCHVVSLSSLDFTVKNGVGGCLRSLLRQLISATPDTADIAILASWYGEPENHGSPLVVIIDDMERCNGYVLSELILMLSEWMVKIPIILVMGVATTIDAPRTLLTSNALQYLSPCKFSLGSPAERMDAIMEAVLLNLCSGVGVGHSVAVFLRNYFLKQDGTITSFIRALNIACVKHFSAEPLSFLCEGLLTSDSQSFWSEKLVNLPESLLKYASNLASCERRDKFEPVTAENLVLALSEMKRTRKNWSSVVLCLYESGKFDNLKLFDIFCEALDPSTYDLRASNHQSKGGENLGRPSSKDCNLNGGYSALQKRGVIFQAIRRVRDLPVAQLSCLLLYWKEVTEGISEIHGRVEELLDMLKLESSIEAIKHDAPSTSEKIVSRKNLVMQKDTRRINDKAVALMECMVQEYLKPIECLPLHEIFCFKNVEILQSALLGDPRRMIQIDLLKSHSHLNCSCCTKNGNAILPSMNDSSIIYKLAQEHGDLINLHDWFQSFKSIVIPTTKKGKRKVQQSPAKKRKCTTSDPAVPTEASVQARFCKAVTDLQITGLLRMPSKRRPDFIQRVAFGL